VAGFSAAIPPGRLTVVVGPSGAGKTTLLRLLNRLDDPDGGAVLFAGRDGGREAGHDRPSGAASSSSGRCR
jgi:ABC-type multidrug transport system ATPase subunit